MYWKTTSLSIEIFASNQPFNNTFIKTIIYCYLPGYMGATDPRCDSSHIGEGRVTGAVPGRGPLEGYVVMVEDISGRGYIGGPSYKRYRGTA